MLKVKTNKKELLEEMYTDEEGTRRKPKGHSGGPASIRSFGRGKAPERPASETIKKMEVRVAEEIEESEEMGESEENKEKQTPLGLPLARGEGQIQRPEQYESKVWLIITVLAILLLIVIALGLGFLIFL